MSYVLDINGWKKTAEIMKKEKKTTKTSKSKNLLTDTGINVTLICFEVYGCGVLNTIVNKPLFNL